MSRSLPTDSADEAEVLTPESLWNLARLEFFRGRIAIFDDRYENARRLLEESIQFDPTRAYAFNALGIAYLEQARFDEAKAAFQDAIARAPRWAYAYHNLALAHQQTGGYTEAIVAYRRAMAVAPQYGYLPYNLGLLYQKINRPRQTRALLEEALDKATAIESEDHRNRHVALAYNALGYLWARRDREKAQSYYNLALDQARDAPELLAKDTVFLEVRHNLATLYAEQLGQPAEAIKRWQAVLADKPDYAPSRLGLALALEDASLPAAAIEQYKELIRRSPGYVAAYRAVAVLQLQIGRPTDALQELEQALRLQPENPIIYEEMGGAHVQNGDPTQARAAFQKALELSRDRKTRRRLRNALAKLPAPG